MIGISDVIIPACDAEVYSKAFASKIKYKHGSKKAMKELPHINIANIIDTNPKRLKFCDFVKLHLF